MKYCARNDLSHFRTHDAMMKLIDCQNGTVTFSVKALNISKDALENPFDIDMQLTEAFMTLKDLHVRKLTEEKYYSYDPEGNKTFTPEVVHLFPEAEKRFLDVFRKDWGCSIHGHSFEKEGNLFLLELETNSPDVFLAECLFSSVKIEWDDYCGKAWYENKH